jgi:hypothetical protein
VINALEDAVLLPSIDRCIRRDAFQNYLLQTRRGPARTLPIRAIKVAAIHDMFSKLSTSDYQSADGAVAKCVSELTGRSEDVITHLGNGILLTACAGHSALNKDAFNRLEAAGVRQRLRDFDLPLRVIIGEELTVTQSSNPTSCSWSRAPSKAPNGRKRSFRAGRISGNGCRSASPRAVNGRGSTVGL